MSREVILTPNAPKPPPVFSQAIRSGGFVFVSGQGPFDPQTGEVSADIREQTSQSLRNVQAILEAAGTSLAHAVSATLIFRDEADFPAINEVWMQWFPVNPPARQGATLPVSTKGMRVSIAMIAAMPD